MVLRVFFTSMSAYCNRICLVQDEDIKIAIEDAGFEAEILPESNSTRSKSEGTLSGQFRIGGMTCAACVNSVEGILRKLPGVKRAVVALATSLGEVEYDPTCISKDDIVQAIEDAGFEGAFLQSSEQDKITLGIAGMSNEMDVQLLEGIVKSLKGVRQCLFNKTLVELEVLFDPEVVGLRSIVDTVERQSNGKFKACVRNPYATGTSNDMEESAHMFWLFTSSLILSVSAIMHGVKLHTCHIVLTCFSD